MTGGETPAPALELRQVAYRFEGAAMRFDLTVAAGECLAIIGPSGAGKSTLLDLVAGFITPGSGTIRIAGRDMAGVEPAARPVSFVFQENNLFAHLTALGNVALGLTPRLRLGAEVRARAAEALASVGLAGFEERRPAEMSGGERQRVALARAFLRGRPLLLLDEPFAALGPALRREMMDLLRALRAAATTPMTILMVTHHPEDAHGFADRIAFVEDGRIAALGAVDDILAGPGDARVRAYLGRESAARQDAI